MVFFFNFASTFFLRTQLRFLLSPKLESREGATLRDRLHWLELERRHMLTGGIQDGPSSEDNGPGEIFLPGAGFAKDLFENLWVNITISLLVWLKLLPPQS